MSRNGKCLISVRDVEFSYENRLLSVEGSKGKLDFIVGPTVKIDICDNDIRVSSVVELKKNPILGTVCSLIRGMIYGVTIGFKKEIDLVGVGYRVSLQGNKLEMILGFSHPVHYILPDGISATVNGNTKVILESADKQLLGQSVANIRSYRPPEPYRGKGILSDGELVIRKAGKSGKK